MKINKYIIKMTSKQLFKNKCTKFKILFIDGLLFIFILYNSS